MLALYPRFSSDRWIRCIHSKKIGPNYSGFEYCIVPLLHPHEDHQIETSVAMTIMSIADFSSYDSDFLAFLID
jgi:hypothetical protein